jgi:MATE family multidrug resistance protein
MISYSLRAGRAWPLWPFDVDEARRLAGQAAPIAAISLVNMGMSITDTVMAAGLGAETLAGIAIASDYYSLLFFLVAGTIGGLAPLYAAASENHDRARLGRLRGGGWAVAIACAVLVAPLLWQAPRILHGIGIDPALVEAGRGYCKVMAIAMFPGAVAAVCRARLTALERPGLLLKVTLAALPLNALGNWVLMFGIGDWNGFGATGLALSSLVVWSFVATVLLVLARRAEGVGDGPLFDVSTALEIARVGTPIGILMVAETGVFLGATIYVGTFSTHEAAAHAIAIRLTGLSYAVSIGLNQATMVRVARQVAGAGRVPTIASALTLALAAGGALCLALVGAAAGLSFLSTIPGDLAQAATLAVPAVALLALMECVAPLGATADGVLRGQRDTRAAMAISLSANWLIAAPAALLLTQVLPLGVTGLWLGLALGVLNSAAMMCCRLPRHWHDNPLSRS